MKRDEVWVSIRWFCLQNGYSPSVREIAKDVGLSVATTQTHIDNLEAEGRVTRVAGQSRTLRALTVRRRPV